ncbi:hypothetical protein [Delftia sp. PE138]|uniref:hypothetical protein n=1 Tax=Delftia sp. PE138 TaxID=1812483 RepID=UPI001BAFD934|nr:hypothetical protein [Delftia sp. PE138]MBS3721869.1 hypothetical protein [Delftia sp. PE138]
MFSALVNIYRLIGLPSFGESYSIDVTIPSSVDLLRALKEYNFDGSSLAQVEWQTLDSGDLRVEIELPQRGDGYFYATFTDFFHSISYQINVGSQPEFFYIRDLDYAYGEEYESIVEVSNLYKFIKFVKDLRAFSAVALDDNYENNSSRVIFLRAADGKTSQQATTLKIEASIDLLNVPLPHAKMLEYVKVAKEKSRPHVEEKIVILNSSISEVIAECEHNGAEFAYLVRNWRKVIKKYYHNWDAYMNGFSFDAIRKKISDSVIDSTTKINNAVGDLGTKILAVPVSMAALVAVQNSERWLVFFIGLVGIVIASYILRITIEHYRLQLDNLINTFQFNMEAASSSSRSFGASIRSQIEKIEDHIDVQRRKISKTLFVYETLAILPVLLGCILVLYRYAEEMDYARSLYLYCYFENGFFGLIKYLAL